jgi:hypothetical protein
MNSTSKTALEIDVICVPVLILSKSKKSKYLYVNFMPRDSSENFHFASFHIDAEIIHFGPTNSQKNRVQWKTLQADKIAIFVNDKI